MDKFSLYRELIHASELVEYGLLKHKETNELLATDRNVIPDKKTNISMQSVLNDQLLLVGSIILYLSE